MVFIAYNYEDYPLSVVCARSKDLAMAYWQGQGLRVHYTKCLEEDYTPIEDHITGIYPLIETKTVSTHTFSTSPRDRKDIVVVKRYL